MNALVSGLIRPAAPGPVITSQARGDTAAQYHPAATPSSAVPAATASDEAAATAPLCQRRAGTVWSPRAGSGRGIGTDMVASSVRETPRPRARRAQPSAPRPKSSKKTCYGVAGLFRRASAALGVFIIGAPKPARGEGIT